MVPAPPDPTVVLHTRVRGAAFACTLRVLPQPGRPAPAHVPITHLSTLADAVARTQGSAQPLTEAQRDTVRRKVTHLLAGAPWPLTRDWASHHQGNRQH